MKHDCIQAVMLTRPARTLKAKAKAKHYQGQGHGHRNAKAYDEIWSNEILFFRVLLQGYKHSLIASLITDIT